MKSYFQVSSNHSGESTPTIILHADKKYMFNCSENFMRFQRQHKIRFIQEMNFLLTRLSSETLDGLHSNVTNLFGTGMSIGNRIYGPKGTVEMFQAMKTKYYIKLLPFSVATIGKNHGDYLLGIRDMESIFNLQNSKEFPFHYFESESKSNNFFKKKYSDKQNILNDAKINLNEEGVLIDKNLEIVAIEVDTNILTYLIKFAKPAPKINKEKLSAFNIPGKLIKELQLKNEIVFNGKTIFLKDIIEEEQDPFCVIIFDCPNATCIENLIKSEKVPFNLDHSSGYKTIAVFHMAPAELLKSSQYSELLEKFNDKCQHIFISSYLKDDISDTNQSEASHITATNLLAEKFKKNYPLISSLDQEKVNISSLFPFLKNGVVAKQNYEFIVASQKYLPLKQQNSNKSAISIQDFEQASSNAINYIKSNLSEDKTYQQLTLEMQKKTETFDPFVFFLGTTCMMPTTFRNNSSILVHDKQRETAIMLDCGEGTYYQMLNQFGEEQCAKVLKDLKLLIITHAHSDHYLGFQGVIYQRSKAIQQLIAKGTLIEKDVQPLYLVLPWCLAPWFIALDLHSEHMECKVIYIQDYNEESIISLFKEYKKDEFSDDELLKKEEEEKKMLLEGDKKETIEKESKNECCKKQKEEDPDCQEDEEEDERDHKSNVRAQQLLKFLEDGEKTRKKEINDFKLYAQDHLLLKKLQFIPVIHCSQAYGVVFEHSSGVKISYSGDTRPCELFAEAAKGSDLLIHEATFNDDLLEYAKKARHSSLSEALDIATNAEAKAVVLTHISKRHMKLNFGDFSDVEGNPRHKFIHYQTSSALDHFYFKLSEFYTTPFISRASSNLFLDYD